MPSSPLNDPFVALFPYKLERLVVLPKSKTSELAFDTCPSIYAGLKVPPTPKNRQSRSLTMFVSNSSSKMPN